VVAAFAVAMAWVESAVVFYLRTMIDRIQPYQPCPLPFMGNLDRVELAREAATLVMHTTIALLAGKTWRARFGFMAISFGIWDISYYAFLKVMCDWPRSLMDWDVLFLLLLPWWGPVLAPVSIALLMIAWGTFNTQFERTLCATAPSWKLPALSYAGVVLALYVFMADAISIADQGETALRNMLPVRFDWPLFCVAFCLMATPVATEARMVWINRKQGLTADPSTTM
jgi:hypothetical protein